MRFVLGPEDRVVADVAAKAPGRGAWVRADRDHVGAAVRRGGFSRAFKRSVTAPSDLADQVEQSLARRCLDGLGLARRGGGLAYGYQACLTAIQSKPALWRIEARDGAADGRLRLTKLEMSCWGRPAPMCGCFSGAEIGMALGREDVIHAVLLQEGLAQRWSADIGRLAGFRAITPPEWS